MIARLSEHYPELSFAASSTYMWSPSDQTIYYDENALDSTQSTWSLLHELGHALLGHASYETDFDLLLLEVDAWRKARELAKNYGVEIDEDHIQNCLDSYRDWLHKRSKCPECNMVCLGLDVTTYRCHNCGCSWKVSESQICRIQRRKIIV